MDRKKKKQAAMKAAANVEQQRKALKERFEDRVTKLILLTGGETLLDQFHPMYLNMLYECRYPVLKAKAAPGTVIPKSRIVQFNKLMLQLMDGVEIPLPNGNNIPLSWYLSEGITLVDQTSTIDAEKEDAKLKAIKSAFEIYAHEGEFHRNLQDLLVDLVTDTCTLLSDYRDCIYRADLAMTPYFAEFSPSNDIFIYTFTPKKERIKTDKGLRDAIRLGWASPNLTWENFKVKPSALGFASTGLDIPLDVYISSHVLERLQQRLDITPGIMHQILLLTFLQDKIPHRWMGDYSHVEFKISDQKVGYLTVRLYEGKLIIHTFLFLTNDGTYEGNKLNKMLDLVKTDKIHLNIDTLPAINSYHIDKNDELSKMFKDAGCGSLLQLAHLQEFSVSQQSDKDPESILQYLADAAYFTRKHASDVD